MTEKSNVYLKRRGTNSCTIGILLLTKAQHNTLRMVSLRLSTPFDSGLQPASDVREGAVRHVDSPLQISLHISVHRQDNVTVFMSGKHVLPSCAPSIYSI